MHLKSVDLDNFPTSKTAKRMLERISPTYDRSYVMKWLLQVMGAELDEMKNYVKSLPLQRFPEVATWGIRYLEQKYGLESDESKTLEERRALIMAARPYRGPITPWKVEQLVKDVSGAETAVTEYPKDSFFKVDIDDTGKNVDFEAVANILDKAKPSHLDYEINLTAKIGGTNYTGITVVEKYSKTIIMPYNETKDRGYN